MSDTGLDVTLNEELVAAIVAFGKAEPADESTPPLADGLAEAALVSDAGTVAVDVAGTLLAVPIS